MGYRLLPSENGGFLQVSGLTCKVNTAIPSGVEIDSTDSSFVKVTYEYGKNSRVQDIEIGGKAIDLDKTSFRKSC